MSTWPDLGLFSHDRYMINWASRPEPGLMANLMEGQWQFQTQKHVIRFIRGDFIVALPGLD